MHILGSGANFRRTPHFATNNIIGILNPAQQVEITGQAQHARWLPARAVIGDKAREGFISRHVLRSPVSPSREQLVAYAVSEWLRFGRGQLKEDQEPAITYIRKFWHNINMSYRQEWPWSAAFLSYIVSQVEGYADFSCSAAHSRYCNPAICARLEGFDYPFMGFRIDEAKPDIGDFIAQWRQTPISYEEAAKTNNYPSHCDVVVGLGQGQVFVIGGNVSNSVTLRAFPLGDEGFLDNRSTKFYAVLKNRT